MGTAAPEDHELPASIAPLESWDREPAADVLARAFCDNPLNVAVIGDGDPERRVRSNLHGMRSLLPVAESHGHGLTVRAGPRVMGALISAPPGAYPLPLPDLAARIRCLVGQGLRVAIRWGRVFEALHERRRSGIGWYLGALGVDPAFQGRGFGSALVAAWLDEVDRRRCPATLETDKPASVRFYARAGFEVEEEIAVLDTPIWRMRRPVGLREISTKSNSQ